MKQGIPNATVQRLPLYLKCLEECVDDHGHISSEDLAARARVNSAKVRKDLSFLGSYGVRGVGYDPEHLRFQIRRELGLEREWPLVIVGMGNLGRALVNFEGFRSQGFRLAGLFDIDPAKIGDRIDGFVVEPLERLGDAVRERGAAIGAIATPASAAQEVADLLAASGIKSILNFAATVLKVPEGIHVRRVDFSTELQVLAFYLHREQAGSG